MRRGEHKNEKVMVICISANSPSVVKQANKFSIGQFLIDSNNDQ